MLGKINTVSCEMQLGQYFVELGAAVRKVAEQAPRTQQQGFCFINFLEGQEQIAVVAFQNCSATMVANCLPLEERLLIMLAGLVRVFSAALSNRKLSEGSGPFRYGRNQWLPAQLMLRSL